MSISFTDIPLNIRTFGQYIEISSSRAVQKTAPRPHKALLMAQGLAAGTVAEATPQLISGSDAAEGYWGINSHIAAMARAFKKANPHTELWGISIDDAGGGTAATFTATFAGTATAAGEVALYIGGKRFAVSVASGDAHTVVSAVLSAVILAHTDYARLPVTTGEAAGVVTLTAVNKGVVTNGLDVRHSYQPTEALPAGITLTIAAGVTGGTDPTLSTAIAAMSDVQYDTIVIPYTDATSLSAIEAELLTRWGPMEQKEGHCFAAAVGTQSTLASLGNTRNSRFLTIVSAGGAGGNSPTPLWEIASVAAGLDAKQTEIDPARPRQTLRMIGVLPPSEADRFTRTERNTLLTDGIATTYVDAGGVVRVERLITTYQTSALGALDTSFLDVATLRTLAFIRYAVRTRIALKYPRHKLADDGTLYESGQAVVTPSTIKAELISLFRDWEAQGLVEDFDQYKEDLIVERNDSDPNRVDARLSPNLLNAFRIFAGQLQFLL